MGLWKWMFGQETEEEESPQPKEGEGNTPPALISAPEEKRYPSCLDCVFHLVDDDQEIYCQHPESVVNVYGETHLGEPPTQKNLRAKTMRELASYCGLRANFFKPKPSSGKV